MRVITNWESGMKFHSVATECKIEMDAKAPIGRGSAMSPKELVIAGLCGCTAMDVVGWLRKGRVGLQTFRIQADVTMRVGGHPMVFDQIHLRYDLEGEMPPSKVEEAVRLSQTQYCSVSAMLSQSAKIVYQVYLNGVHVCEGEADFNGPKA